MPAWKFIALVASGVTFFGCTFPDLALFAMHKKLIRFAAVALNIPYGKGITILKTAFAGNAAFVKLHQPFFEFDIIVSVGDINGADPAVKTAG